MYDPNETLEVEVDGVGKFQSRLLSERQLNEFNRATDINGKLTLEEHHRRLNIALRIPLVDADLESLTLGQKIRLVEKLPWAITSAELDSLKKAAPSPLE